MDVLLQVTHSGLNAMVMRQIQEARLLANETNAALTLDNERWEACSVCYPLCVLLMAGLNCSTQMRHEQELVKGCHTACCVRDSKTFSCGPLSIG